MKTAWEQNVARVNESVFGVFARVCKYLPKAGDSFDLRYILREPTPDQPSVPGYFAELEVIPDELGDGRARYDQVEIDRVRYVVNRIAAHPLRNTMLELHRVADL